MSAVSNVQTSGRMNERNLFLLWLLVNVITLAIGWTNLPAMAIMGAIAAVGQWIILRWSLGITWPWLILGPVSWFYSIYGGTILGSVFLPLAGYDYNSPFYAFLSALIPGTLIGLCGFLLFRKHLPMASRWILIHTFAFAVASIISPYASDMAGRIPTAVELIRGLAAALLYSAITGVALVFLRKQASSI